MFIHNGTDATREAFEHGKVSFKNGIDRNPYRDYREYDAWRQGYEHAEDFQERVREAIGIAGCTAFVTSAYILFLALASLA